MAMHIRLPFSAGITGPRNLLATRCSRSIANRARPVIMAASNFHDLSAKDLEGAQRARLHTECSAATNAAEKQTSINRRYAPAICCLHVNSLVTSPLRAVFLTEALVLMALRSTQCVMSCCLSFMSKCCGKCISSNFE